MVRPTILFVGRRAPGDRDSAARLRALGYTVVGPAETEAAAIRLVTETRPDLALVIDSAEDGDGGSLAAELRRRDIPLLAFMDGPAVVGRPRAPTAEPAGWLSESDSDVEWVRAVERVARVSSIPAILYADVVSATAWAGPLPDMLRRCAEALVRDVPAVLARVWTVNATGDPWSCRRPPPPGRTRRTRRRPSRSASRSSAG